MVIGIRRIVVAGLIKLNILLIALRVYKSLPKAIKAGKQLSELRKSIYGNQKIIKAIHNEGKYYWDLYAPGWPSEQFDRFISSELLRLEHVASNKKIVLNTLIFAITKKCPLQCEHCFEWEALNKKDTLNLEKIEGIIKDFVNAGVISVHLSGGEPLLKLKEIAPVVKKYSDKSDFWLLTSGYMLDESKAELIKSNGLKGVIISLDHHQAMKHNAFRGLSESFEWVEKAIVNCKKNGLITTLTLCVTRAMANENDVNAYMNLAKDWQVDFVQWLEPKAVGHYENKDVALSSEQQQLLDKLYLKYNYSISNNSYPIVDYHGYHQRRVGCFSAGNRNLYVDTDGNIQACPFCKTKIITAENYSVINNAELVCEDYEKAVI